jgi:hypothetical protein
MKFRRGVLLDALSSTSKAIEPDCSWFVTNCYGNPKIPDIISPEHGVELLIRLIYQDLIVLWWGF